MEPQLFHVDTFYKIAVETCAAIQQCRRITRAAAGNSFRQVKKGNDLTSPSFAFSLL